MALSPSLEELERALVEPLHVIHTHVSDIQTLDASVLSLLQLEKKVLLDTRVECKQAFAQARAQTLKRFEAAVEPLNALIQKYQAFAYVATFDPQLLYVDQRDRWSQADVQLELRKWTRVMEEIAMCSFDTEACSNLFSAETKAIKDSLMAKGWCRV